jgi:hypothetical protein
MLDLFKKSTREASPDVKTLRNNLLLYIKDELKKSEGGEGNNIKGLHLFVNCNAEEKHMYESALYFEEENRFKNEEVQKIADDFAIDLPANWTMEISFVDTLPPDAKKFENLQAALLILTRKRLAQQVTTAYLKVRIGKAEKEIYTLNSTKGKVCIGREKKVQTADGFYRENNIAFPESSDESNKYISRQHAHIEYDGEAGNFLLYADEGGVPPRNKIKIRAANNPNPIKLYTTQIGHPLQEGDQILLGESALLEFTYSPDENIE